MERVAKIVDGFQLLIIFSKKNILAVLMGSKFASECIDDILSALPNCR